MFGVLVNAAAVIVGGALGVLLKKGIPARIEKTVMVGLGLCVLAIGIRGAIQWGNVLVMILSMVLGGLVGGLLRIDDGLNRLGDWVQRKVKKIGSGGSVAEGFVSGTLLFCVGAMTIMGSLNAGLRGDNQILYTKAILDLFAAMMMAATLGGGVILSAAALFAIEAPIALFAGVLAPILSDAMVTEITCVGSAMTAAIGLNLMGITKIKVADYLPGLIFAPFLSLLFAMIPL